MRFTLSGTSPLNSIYTDESGKATYKVTTPRALIGITTSVSRILPPDLTGGGDASSDEERYGHLATIKHVVGTSIINFGGKEFRTADHFKKHGVLWRDKSCIGPDGKAYKWRIRRYWGCEFVRDDGEEEAVLAKFMDRTLGIFGPSSPASFEIFPGGEAIMDYIFVTFLYVEKVRRDRKKG